MSISPTSAFLRRAIEASPMTQREIARAAGFPAPNALSMMKTGECKVPISRIPALAKTLEINCEQFLKVALREYQPEIWMALEEALYSPITEFEQELLATYEFICGSTELPWDDATQSLMNGLFRLLRDRHLHTIGKAAMHELDPSIEAEECAAVARELDELKSEDRAGGDE